MSLIRSSAWAASAAVMLTVSRFALGAILARRLSLEAFGQYAYAQWIVDLAFLVCALGATGVVSRYLAEFREHPEMRDELIQAWRPFAIGLPLVAGAAAIFGMWVSGNSLSWTSMAMLALWAIGNGLWSMQTAALIGLQRFDLVFYANFLAALVMLGGALMLPIHGSDMGPLFGLMAAAAGSAAIVGYRTTRPITKTSVGSIDSFRRRGIRTYAFNMWLTALLWSLVWSRGELPIVRAYLGDVGVAQYSVAMVLLGGAMQGIMLAVSAVAPQLTALMGSDRIDQAIATARALMDMQLLLCGLGTLTLVCFGSELLSLAFGSAYGASSGALAVLSLGLVGLAVSSQNHILQITTDARFNRNITLLGLLLLAVFGFLSIPRFGIEGAALARAGTMLLLGSISLLVFVRAYGIASVSLRNTIAVPVLCTVAMVPTFIFSGDMGISIRTAIYVVLSIGLVLFIRDRNGRVVLFSVVHQIVSVARSTRRGHQAREVQ